MIRREPYKMYVAENCFVADLRISSIYMLIPAERSVKLSALQRWVSTRERKMVRDEFKRPQMVRPTCRMLVR